MAEKENKGVLVALVASTNNEIKKERAGQVLTGIHTIFKQKIDACYNNINDYKIQQTELLHKIAPTNTMTTQYDVNTTEFVDKNIALVKSLFNEEMYFNALKAEYLRLFGKEYEEPQSFL